ncbi:Putative Fe-S oxidoreductase [Mycobacteroides abscessus subsp. abscessus]|nr:Putative Fe-S oxidoreductase [Mycobacteroides abscessus subsp. abscessus]
MKGLGIAAGARRPGAKKAAPATESAPEPAQPATASEPTEPATSAPKDEAPETSSTPEPPVKGLGIAPGARRPGRRN